MIKEGRTDFVLLLPQRRASMDRMTADSPGAPPRSTPSPDAPFAGRKSANGSISFSVERYNAQKSDHNFGPKAEDRKRFIPRLHRDHSGGNERGPTKNR